MKKNVVSLAAVFGLALAFAGCGNDNEQACKDFINKVQDCGGVQASAYTDALCETMGDYDCDVAEYFDCVSDALGSCVDGDFPNVDATAATTCVTTKLTCD